MCSDGGEKRPSAPASMKQRISQLEDLVLSINGSPRPSGSNGVVLPDTPESFEGHSRTNQSNTTDGFGHLSLDDNEVSYAGANHWTSLIDGVGTSIPKTCLMR